MDFRVVIFMTFYGFCLIWRRGTPLFALNKLNTHNTLELSRVQVYDDVKINALRLFDVIPSVVCRSASGGNKLYSLCKSVRCSGMLRGILTISHLSRCVCVHSIEICSFCYSVQSHAVWQ